MYIFLHYLVNRKLWGWHYFIYGKMVGKRNGVLYILSVANITMIHHKVFPKYGDIK